VITLRPTTRAGRLYPDSTAVISNDFWLVRLRARPGDRRRFPLTVPGGDLRARRVAADAESWGEEGVGHEPQFLQLVGCRR
jgi:hypothetical protein